MCQLSPVRRAINIADDAAKPIIEETLACIDEVHQDGALPFIAAMNKYFEKGKGEGEYERDKQTQRPLRINIDSRAKQPLLTTLHEIGHFLDHQALDRPGEFASETSGRLAGWKMAVYQSEAVFKLVQLKKYQVVDISLDEQRVERFTVSQAYRVYLLKDREIFARSYAQYITQKCNNESLKAELERLRRTKLDEQFYHRQWSDVDFVPIENALSTLFLEMGWLL